MNKIFIVNKKGEVIIMEPSDSGELELEQTDSIRFEIDGFFFDVQIDAARKVLTVQKTVTAGALYVPIIIQPVHQTAISLT